MIINLIKRIGNYLILLVNPKHYKNLLFSNFEYVSLSNLTQNRLFEPDLLLLDRYIHQGDICFDIGSNNGEYTFLFEKYAGAKNVYAFEPILKLNKILKKIFTDVNIFQIALSSKNQICDFKIPKINNFYFYSRGKLDIQILEPNETDSHIVKVECRTLDSFVSELNLLKLNFIKIDVEGHEFEIIKGGINTFKKFKPIILLEIEQRHHDFNIKEIFDFIEALGYKMKFYNILDDTFLPVSNFSSTLNQNYENIKTINYINNFWCFPE